jgi:branched-subunit amino acid ABC-type transport system permease component
MLKPSSRLFWPIDALIWRIFRLDVKQERTFAAQRDSVEDIAHLLHDMSIIDGKSSALLTHVSIMLAVVALLMTLSKTVVWQLLMTGELLAFSLVGMMLLRCVDILGPPRRELPASRRDRSNWYRQEILVRRSLYQLTVRAVFILTLVLLAIVLTKTVMGWQNRIHL